MPTGELDKLNGAPAPRHHILTVSVEEYFHGIALSKIVLSKHWDRFESRVDRHVDDTLEQLGASGARATFFVMGLVAERRPEIARRIAEAGHEVASRGYWPRGVGGMTVEEFVADTDRAKEAIEAASGHEVRGYRSPRWLHREDLWILEVLARKGYLYDSSINPVLRRFSGQPQFFTVARHQLGEARIWEVPISTTQVLGHRVAISGGNYWRQLPHRLLRRAVHRWDREIDAPLVCYFTPWELDAEQPVITAASGFARMRQYRNLAKTRWVLHEYMQRFSFVSISEHLGLRLEKLESPPLLLGRPPEPAPPLASGERVAVSVVVPMHNEEPNVPFLLNTMASVGERLGHRYDFELVLVDDGSTDGTWTVLEELCTDRPDVKLVRHDRNRGVAAAIMTGIRAASADVVCSVDCDCSYDPHDLENLLPLLKDADLVTASPYHAEGQVVNVPRWRLFLSRSLSRIYGRVLSIDLATYTSCFRAYRKTAVQDLELDYGDFRGIAEILIRVHRAGGRIVEYPAVLESRLMGYSKMRTLRMIRGHLGLLGKVLRRRV